jgi:hypothetical protein
MNRQIALTAIAEQRTARTAQDGACGRGRSDLAHTVLLLTLGG